MPEKDLLSKLQAENARLVALLESHRIEWRQPLASLPAALEPSKLTPGEKVALFRRLFRGRTDVYPTRWESKTTGNSSIERPLAESHLTRQRFASMLRRIWVLPVPTG
jgi:hypothetical protein